MKYYKRKPTKLIGDNHHLIIHKNSKKLMIFFTGTGAKAGNFFFYNIGQKLDCNILFINNGENEWYQEGIPSLGTSTFDETLSVLKAWSKYLDIKEIYTCGASMGAYGAILYGIKLDARVLAFGPELVLNELGSRSIKLMKKNQLIRFDLVDMMRLATNKIYIYVGEDEPIDIYQASKVSSLIDFINVSVTSLMDVGHNIGMYLKKRNRLKPLLEDFIYNKPMPKILEEGTSCFVHDFAESYYQQYCFFKEKNWDEVIIYGEKAITQYPIGTYAQYMLGIAYVEKKDFSSGLIHLAIARGLAPTNIDYQFSEANCIRRMGYLNKARYLHLKTLQSNKNHGRTHYDLSLIYAKNGNIEGALARAKQALAIEPMNLSFQKRVQKLTLNKKK